MKFLSIATSPKERDFSDAVTKAVDDLRKREFLQAALKEVTSYKCVKNMSSSQSPSSSKSFYKLQLFYKFFRVNLNESVVRLIQELFKGENASFLGHASLYAFKQGLDCRVGKDANEYLYCALHLWRCCGAARYRNAYKRSAATPFSVDDTDLGSFGSDVFLDDEAAVLVSAVSGRGTKRTREDVASV